MNWFKKQINKLFDNEIDEEEYYEEEIIEEQSSLPNNEERADNSVQPKKSFKFPLLADEDMILSKKPPHVSQHNDLNYKKSRIEDSKYFYQKNAVSKVYDVEVSGIRELLENRKNNKKKSNRKIQPLESNKYRTIEREMKKKQVNNSYKKATTSVKRGVEEDLEKIVPQRRFVPTQVPSPVHGFKKPSDINQLLTKKKEVVESDKKQETFEEYESTQKANPPMQDNDNKGEMVYIEVEKAIEEIASSVETMDKDSRQTEKKTAKYESPTTSFIESEDDDSVNENQVRLAKVYHHPIEDTPIVAEEVVELTEVKVQDNDDLLPQQKSVPRSKGNQEEVAITTQRENENIQLEDDKEQFNNKQQEQEQEQEEIQQVDLTSTQNERMRVDCQPIAEEHVQETQGANEHHDIFEEKKITPINIQTIHPAQSEEVQQLVSIALSEEEITLNVSEEELQEKKQSKGSSLPFNVLMLKSDKEKYAAKLAQKQAMQHNDDIKEFSRHSSNIEELNETQSIIEKTEETNRNSSLDMPIEEKNAQSFYVKPSLEFLSPPEEKMEDREWLESRGEVLVESLSYFQVTAQVESITQGPAVTQFEITVGHGTKVSKIRNLADDLKLALAAKDIRIQAPIPGKSSIGIEIPNRISRAVRLSEVTCSESFIQSESPLEAALGLDLTGKPVTIDLRKMPHGLIAGATGSGKSVCINSILVSLLYKADPHELKLMLIDPKMVELAPFNHTPHLVSPVITDVKAATAALKWAVEEMERRYQLFAHAGVRDLPRFNKLADSKGEYGHKLPYILIVIDELADLMMMSPTDVEEAICRIAQKARACGIHLIVATQRPSVDVITGLIKSNIPTRIAFAVSSQVDSRTILDSQGAERLLGRGDMLYLGNGMSAPIRLQGTFVTDDEIEDIIEHVKAQGEPDYVFEQDELLKKTEMIEEQDELFEEVCRFVHEQGTASTSSIQRKYHIGYNRAARLIDLLERHGFVSEQRGSKPREVFITDSDLASMFE